MQCFAQKVLNTHVSPISQEVLNGCDELRVYVASEGMARIIGQDSNQHDSIVLDTGWGGGWVRQQLANAMGGLLRGIGTGFSALDDGREVDEFFSLLKE